VNGHRCARGRDLPTWRGHSFHALVSLS
jgi:hypothetical protein